MRSSSKKRLTVVFLILGILMICTCAFLAVFSEISARESADRAKETSEELRALMPEPFGAAADHRTNVSMPMLELDGENFIAILEIPILNTSLPVGADWDTDKLSDYPCRYTGSTYDNTLIIGGRDSIGQLDFAKTISIGNEVFVTDVTGARYSYTVEAIERTKDVSTEALTDIDGHLILFMRNTYSLDYTLVICKAE